MDMNHDYVETEPFLLAGVPERLQACKCAVLAFGDMGYTDPAIPSLKSFIGEYTDSPTNEELEKAIRSVLTISQLASEKEIQAIQVISPVGADYFTVSLEFTFGTEVFDVPAVL